MQWVLKWIPLSFLLSYGLSALKNEWVKRPDSKEEYRAILLQIHEAIKLAYLGDPDFS